MCICICMYMYVYIYIHIYTYIYISFLHLSIPLLVISIYIYMLFNVIPCSFRNVPALPAAYISGLRRCCAGQSASTPKKMRGARGQMVDLERENGWLI